MLLGSFCIRSGKSIYLHSSLLLPDTPYIRSFPVFLLFFSTSSFKLSEYAKLSTYLTVPHPEDARIFAARIPALAPPLIATVATGMPLGICTMEYKGNLHRQIRSLHKGYHRSLEGKDSSAHSRKVSRFFPAPAMITLNPFFLCDLCPFKTDPVSLWGNDRHLIINPKLVQDLCRFAITGIYLSCCPLQFLP